MYPSIDQEQPLSLAALIISERMACRVALCCLVARMASPEHAVTTAVVSAVHQVCQEAAEDRAEFQALLDRSMAFQTGSGAQPLALPPPPSEAVPATPPAPSTAIVPASAGARIKHKREHQSDSLL